MARQVHVMLPPELVEKLDKVATETFINRTEFIKQAVLEKLEAYEEWQAMIAGLVLHGSIPDEKELLRILQKRLNSRSWNEEEKEWRRLMRQKSLARKAARQRKLG